MSEIYLSSPRKRGSQSLNEEKNCHTDDAFQTATPGYDNLHLAKLNHRSSQKPKYSHPELVEGYSHPELVEGYSHPELVEGHSHPEPVEGYSHPELVEGYSHPELVEGHSHPELVEGHSHPEPVEGYSHPEPVEGHSHPELVEGYSHPEPVEGHKKPTLNIGLFGFGCVGQGLYDVLNHSQGLKAEIGKICVKDKTKPRSIAREHFTFSRHEVLDSGEHNLVVELTSDADAALEIITSSLLSGRNVVTAGKKVLAENFELLYSLQQQTGASLLYEAACAGSIPIIRTLEEYYDNELLSSVRGILNGSSNYILSKMELDKLTYHDALLQAQLAGFAEADPVLDVNGTDAKYKLCLLAAHAFGVIIKPEYIYASGIQNITPFDINYATQNNCRIKLIAGIAKDNGGYRAYVLPKFISRESPLSNINYEFNGIEVEGVYSDKQLFVGKGAGSHPTGSAVLSDISAITYDYKYGYKKLMKRENLTPQPLSYEERGAKPENFRFNSPLERGGCEADGVCYPNFSQDHCFLARDFTIKLYIRYHDSHDDRDSLDSHDSGNARDFLDRLDLQSIEEEYTSRKGNYIIANVGFSSLQNAGTIPDGVFVCEV